MDKESFTKLIADIFLYFRTDKMPSSAQVEFWYRECQHIPSDAIKSIQKEIFRDKDNIPRNIPKSIIEAYGISPHEYRPVTYDKTEDSRFPVELMKDSLVIMQTKGERAFMAFCQQAHMPTNDIDRVMTKHRVILGEIKIDTHKIKNTIAGIQRPTYGNVPERMAILNQQKEIILRQPGEEG
jgi:hypothetical protein